MGPLRGLGGMRKSAVGIRLGREGLAVGRNRRGYRRLRLTVELAGWLTIRQGLDVGRKPLIGLLLVMG